VLAAGTGLVNFQASAATYLSADLRRPKTELPGKLGRASAIYLNKISMVTISIKVSEYRIITAIWISNRDTSLIKARE